MLLSENETKIISSIPYVDHGSLHCWSTLSDRHEKVAVARDGFLCLRAGSNDYFGVIQQAERGGYKVSVHPMDEPDQALARIVVNDLKARFEGDMTAWRHVPKLFDGYIKPTPGRSNFVSTLLLIDADAGECEVQPIDFVGHFDQGLTIAGPPISLPDTDLVLLPRQSSEPTIWSCSRRQDVGRLELADRGGSSKLEFRDVHELWADDYDTLIRLEPSEDGWVTQRSLRLQDEVAGIRSFIGGWAFDRSRNVCAVARPFSRDVVGLDCESFRVKSRVSLGEEPLYVALLSDDRVFVRDWRSGDPHVGLLKAWEPDR